MILVLYLHEHGEISGGETSLLVLWEHLDRRRFQPLLLGPPSGRFIERARRLGVPTHPAQFPRFRDLLTSRGRRCLASIERTVHQIKPSILHSNTPHTNLAAAWIGRRSGCRVIWHERTLPHGDWDVDRRLRFLPDRIICNSVAVAQRFGGPNDRVVVIHNGVSLKEFIPGCGGHAVRQVLGLGPEQVSIGIVGNFGLVKRHELFLEAAEILARDVRDARFLMIGDEVFPENHGREASLRAETNRLGLQGRVIFLGARADMPAVMDSLDILVSACEVEACSRAIIEAMACGTPIVAADAGGNPELVAACRTGLLFPPGNAQALASALRTLIGDPSLRKAMGSTARARAEERFSIQRHVQEIEAVYEDVVRTS